MSLPSVSSADVSTGEETASKLTNTDRSARRRMTVVAAGSTLLAALPLSTVFQRWTWLVQAMIVVIVLGGVALLTRSVRGPVWLPSIAMVGALGLVLSWLFPSAGEIAAVPSVDTLRHFNGLLVAAAQEMRQVGVPVADTPAFLFLAALGVGAVAVLVDLFAVVLRHPSVAGLPMLAIYTVPVAVDPNSVSVVPFLLGSAGFLWLLLDDNLDRVRRFGRRFTGDGRAVRVGTPSPLAAAGRRLGLVGVALAVAVPLVVPGTTGGLVQRFADAGRGGIGVAGGGGAGTGSVNLFAALRGELNLDRRFDMLTVSTTDPQPHYLRFAVADQLGAGGFNNLVPSTGQPATSALPGPVAVDGGISSRYRATVELRNFDMRYLPVYQQPTSVNGVDGSWRYDPRTSVIYSNRRSTKAIKKYGFDYVRTDYSPEALRRAQPAPAEDPVQRRFASVPARIPEIDTLVAQLTGGMNGPYDKVLAIFNHFSTRNGFSYSLRTEPGTSGSQILDFLTNKKGFCVQYAAAMAWLVRAAGIPARVAFGFTRGAGPSGGTTTLTNANLHAWTEVYFAGFGWVPFDPTPASAVTGSASPAWAPNPSRPDTSANPADDVPDRADDSPPGEPDAGPSAGALPGDQTPPQSGSTPAPAKTRWPWWTLAAVVGLLALLTAPALGRRTVRRRRLRLRAPPVSAPPGGAHRPRGGVAAVWFAAPGNQAARHDAHAVWDELLDTMTDYRIAVDPAETPRRTVDRLVSQARLDDAAASGARVIGDAESYARYARTPMHSADLTARLSAVRSAITARASRRTRVLAVVAPPSIIRRWRGDVVRHVAGVTDATARWRETVLRPFSPRRALESRAGR